MTRVWQLTGCLAALIICAQSATAQGFGFSVTTVNGVPMGGGFTVIGAPVQGNTYVRLGVNAWASHPATGSRVLGGFQQNNIFQQGATGGGGFNPGGFNAGQGNFNGGLQFLTGQQGILRIDAEVVRTKDVGFPGLSLEFNSIEFTFPNFDRDKIGVSWSTGPVWGLSDISLSTLALLRMPPPLAAISW